MDISPTLIIGGGIAGLASALALKDRNTLILEQARAFSEIGAGLQLGPNAVRALQKLGAWDAVEPITTSPPEIHMRDGITGKLLNRLILGKNFETRYGAPYRVARRADLHTALQEVVNANGRTQVKLNERASSLEAHLSGVVVHSNFRSIASAAAIVTDGVNSSLRQQLFPNSAAKDSGMTFHRATLALPPSLDFDDDAVVLWLYPQGHVVHYRVGAERQLNLVAVTPKAQSPNTHFAKAAPQLQSLLDEATPHFTTWLGLYVQPLENWNNGNMLLLGDAAHATLPFLAQGAAMALEDAACLAQVLPTTHSMKHAFAEVTQRRLARTKKLHNASISAGQTYHLEGPLRLARNIALQCAPASIIQSKLSWIYKA